MNNHKNIIPKESSQKNNFKKENIVSSLNEVECFLTNLNFIFNNIKLVKILKKFK